MNNKLLIVLLIISSNAFALTEKTPYGVYSESDEINDALYSQSESCEYQADKAVRQALPNISAMCETAQTPMSCEVTTVEIFKQEFIKSCKVGE